MVHYVLPYAVFPIYIAMRGIDLRLERAARSLGARGIAVFWPIVLPLTLPGVFGAAVLVFIISAGFFITPVILGAPSDMMVSNLVDYYVHELVDFGSAAALAVLILAAITPRDHRAATAWPQRTVRKCLNTPLLLLSVPLLLFLLLPSLVIVPMALTQGQMIQFPPEWISMHAFTDYLADAQWVGSTLLSLRDRRAGRCLGRGLRQLGGDRAAWPALSRARSLIAGVILAPIVVPLVVLALGDYLLFAPLRLVGQLVAIGLVHGLLVTPYVFISVQTSLAASLNPALVRSARSLGAGCFVGLAPRLLAGDPAGRGRRVAARLRGVVR